MINLAKPRDSQKLPALGEKDKPGVKDKLVGKDKRVEKDDEIGMNKKEIEKYKPSHKRKKKESDKYEKWLEKWALSFKKEPP